MTKLIDLSNTTPVAAARTLIAAIDRPAAYAVAIVEKGRDYVAAVLAAANVQTEGNPDARRAFYRVVHQAASRMKAPFTIASRKHSGLSVVDAAPAANNGTDGEAGAESGKPAGNRSSNADKIADLSARLAESESERKRLALVVAEHEATIATLRAQLKGNKPARKRAATAVAA